jgi:hypothetical protein
MPISKEQAAKIQDQANARKERSNRLTKNLPPIVYVPDGVIHARFYADSEGNYVKTFYRHKINRPAKLSFQCLGPDRCEACKRLAEIQGWTDGWRFSSREVAITYAYLLQYDGSSEYVKLETPVILMGNHKLANELSETISELGSIDDISKFFDPDELYARLKIKSVGRGREFSSKLLSNQPVTIPHLPENLPPLSEVMYKEGELPPADIVSRYIQIMEKTYEDWKMIKETGGEEEEDKGTRGPGASPKQPKEESYSYPPKGSDSDDDSDEDETPAPPPPKVETPKAEPKAAPKPSPKAEPKAAKPSSPAEPPVGGDASGQPDNCPAAYGQKPDSFLPPCLTCPVDEDCLRATQAAAAAG